MKKIHAIAAVFLPLLMGARLGHAAPCCGGGTSFPSLIVGDDSWQLAFATAYGRVIADAPPATLPVWRASGDHESAQTYTLSAAKLLSDRWQTGVSVPLVSRFRDTAATISSGEVRSTGLGDVGLTLAYESLPEWNYSRFKPRMFSYLQLTLPTGPSVYELSASDPWGLSARGRGFYSFSLGSVALKSLGNWDFGAQAALSLSLGRRFESGLQSGNGSSLALGTGWGASALVSVGWSPGGGATRVGLSLAPVYEGAKDVREMATAASSKISEQLVWNAGIEVSRLLSKQWVAKLAYVDQTLLGPVHNVSLSRTASFMLSYRYER